MFQNKLSVTIFNEKSPFRGYKVCQNVVLFRKHEKKKLLRIRKFCAQYVFSHAFS